MKAVQADSGEMQGNPWTGRFSCFILNLSADLYEQVIVSRVKASSGVACVRLDQPVGLGSS